MANFPFEQVSQMSSDANTPAMHHVEDLSKIASYIVRAASLR